ncbi:MULTISPECIES: hypothetical protein [unclassified Spirosoma]|uniref:hypothetical protein n=1 Tax=unclassified Spirosoma TaxID=2621999 RepID=UPI000B1C24D0|nr:MULTISPECIES: hypothetical protein [unclassified Spirosoma]MBN8820434.1 hypothetical protein [Spirosoma sp.]
MKNPPDTLFSTTTPHPPAPITTYRQQGYVALGWLVVAGAIGVGLRALMLWPVESANYLYWLHAHSHVILLGWAFNALLTALWATFLPTARARTYRHWWIGLQISVAGMLVFFPIQGYAAGSIIFSTLHVWLTYGIGIKLWRDLRSDRRLSASLLRWGIGFLFLSTLGPYVVGILKARGLAHTDGYNLAIYFYLHFLYNGWFMFGVLALLVRQLEGWNVALPERSGRWWLVVWAICCMGSYSLSALWANPPRVVWVLGGLSGGMQLVAGGWLAWWLWKNRSVVRRQLKPWAFRLYQLAWVAFLIKLTLQAVSAWPWAAEWAYLQRPIVIAYLHLVFIGVVSFFLLGKAIQDGYLRASPIGLTALIVFFAALELILIAEPLLIRLVNTSVPYYCQLLFGVSLGLWLSFLALLMAQAQRLSSLSTT